MAGNSGNPIDVNLIAGNIKNGVPIYGVLGTFTGTSGNPINSGKIMLGLPYGSAPAFMGSSGVGCYDDGTYIYIHGGLAAVNSAPDSEAVMGLWIYEKATGILTQASQVATISGVSGGSPQYNSAYLDGGVIHINVRDAGANDFHFDYTILTDTRSASIGGFNTTGIAISNPSITYNSITYTPNQEASIPVLNLVNEIYYFAVTIT